MQLLAHLLADLSASGDDGLCDLIYRDLGRTNRPRLLLSQDNTTLAVAMSSGYTDAYNDIFTNVLAAGAILFVAPVLVLFFFARRFYVRSIVPGSMK